MWLNFSYSAQFVFFFRMFQYDFRVLFRQTKEFTLVMLKAEMKSGQGFSLRLP